MQAAGFLVLLFMGVLVNGLRREGAADTDVMNAENDALDKTKNAGVSDASANLTYADAADADVLAELEAKLGVKSPSLAASIHIRYDTPANGQKITGMYAELKTGPAGVATYWAPIVHQYGYLGYQKREFGTQGVVCSAWDGATIKATHGDKGLFDRRFGGEGTGVQIYKSNWFHWVRPGEHLAFAMLFNYNVKGKPGQVEGKCYVKYKMSRPWHYLGSWYTQAQARQYMTGFIENWRPWQTSSIRSGEYGNAWYRVGGQWKQSGSYSVDLGGPREKGWKGVSARKTSATFLEMKTCGNQANPCISSTESTVMAYPPPAPAPSSVTSLPKQ